MKDFVAGRAYQRAQQSLGRKVSDAATADTQGCLVLRNQKVREAADVARDAKAMKADDARMRIINELISIAFSDASGLAKWVVESCNGCWGDDPQVREAMDKRNEGYPTKINPTCRYCRGRGRGHVSITPTDQLKPDELRVFDGLEVTQHGVKVRLRDRTRALELLAKHFGIGPDRLELTGKDGGPIEITGARDRLLASLNRRTSP